MLKSKISGTVQEVVLPDFPDDENTVTTTVTKSRRVSFGTNFVKEFIVGSAVSAQCMSEYEQAFPSSDSSNADSSHSAAEIGILDQSKFGVPESLKVHKLTSTVGQFIETETVENRPKPSKFSRTICFSADSPTADMEFTEGCITLAKSILDKKNKEMTVIIQAIPKESKEEEKSKEEETKYFDASQFEMSMTKCLKSKENKREEKRFENEKTKIFSKFEDEMSITRCNKIFNNDESDSSWENCKENLMPLDMIMRHLDKDNSDLENDLFSPKNTFNNFLNVSPFDFSNDSEKLNLNESMDISTDFHPNVFKESQKTTVPDDRVNEIKTTDLNLSEKIISNESMEISSDFQPDLSNGEECPLYVKKSNTDELEKICTNLQSDIYVNSQGSVKSDNSEQVFQNRATEIIAETPQADEVIEISLQSKDKVIEDKLTNLKRCDEVNSTESIEICGKFRAEQKLVQFPETVNQSFFGEEICNNKSTDLNTFERRSINESTNGGTDLQSGISEVSENLLLQDDLNNDELIKNGKSDEDLKFDRDIQPIIVDASEKICNEKIGPNEFEKSTQTIAQPNSSEVSEILPPTEQIISDKPMEFKVSEEQNTSGKCDSNCQPQSEEKIVPEVESNFCEEFNENKSMEISTAGADSPLLDKKIANETRLNDLEKLNSENAMEISTAGENNPLLDEEIANETRLKDLEKLNSENAMEISTAGENNPLLDEKIANETRLKDLEKLNSENAMEISTAGENNPLLDEKIANETRLKDLEKLNSENAMDISAAGENNPLLDEKIANETQLKDLEKLNSENAMEISTAGENNPLLDEKIANETRLKDLEKLNSENAMDISAAGENNPLLDEKIANETQLKDLEKLNSENAMEITADDQLIAFEAVENSSPTEAVAVDYSDEPHMNESNKVAADPEPNVPEIWQNSPPDERTRKSTEFNSSNETDEVPTWNREPSLVDIKIIESLKEQSKEPGCIWSLEDLRYPQGKTLGLLSFNCELLESSTTIFFHLECSNDDRLDSCSIIRNSVISSNEEKQCRLPEYELVIEFGFQELKKFFDERRQKVETLRHIPYFLDQINSFLFKVNSYLRQIHSILTLYPGSRLKGSTISFRLFSFPVFFSSLISVDLKDLFRLSKSSLSFENHFGTLDENKIREIFQKCLKNENSLCEFVVQSTNYLFDLEKKSGFVSKRRHIRLLPVELKL